MLAPESAACGAGSLGHPGAGGTVALADPEAELSFAYVANQLNLGLTSDERSARPLAALYAALGRNPTKPYPSFVIAA